MIRGREWTGFEAAALQEAMRQPIRKFAAMLGVETTTINNWRSGLSAVKPRSEKQEILDTTYAKRTTPEDRERFEQIVAEGETAWRVRHSKQARRHGAAATTVAVPANSEPGVERTEAVFARSSDRGSLGADAPLAEADDFTALVSDIETGFWAAGNVTDTGPLRSISALLVATRSVTRLNMAGEYTTFALLVRPLLTDLYRHAHESRGGDQRIAWDALTQVAFDTSVVMRARGHLALAWSAARAAEDAARTIESRPGIAAAAFVSSQVLLARPTSSKAALDRAESVAAVVGSRAQTANDVQTVGMLHLQASLATAATGGDPRDHLEHAAEYAARLDRSLPTDHTTVIANTTFGSSNVALWKMSVAMEAREPDTALDLARKLKPQTLPTPGRAAQYWVEVGRAAASRRAHPVALDAFLRAESIASEHVRNMDTVQEAVAQMMREAKRSLIAGELGNLAHRVGVAVV
ncbi:hypothetical protein [Nocardia salmonicida]|uniref:hypothetical protein n=1 Tax=Nocardia salmonicida TaxID=53431 RepID=UPI0037A240D4